MEPILRNSGKFLQNPLLGHLHWNLTVPNFNFGRVVFVWRNLDLFFKNYYLEWKKIIRPRFGEGKRWQARLLAGDSGVAPDSTHENLGALESPPATVPSAATSPHW